jgi:hypothetical protein
MFGIVVVVWTLDWAEAVAVNRAATHVREMKT